MEKCPVCGAATPHVWGSSAEVSETAPAAKVIGVHVTPAGRCCWVVGYSVDFARAVGRIREQGGERFLLAAHP